MVAEISGFGIAYSDGCAGLQEKHRLRFAHNIGRAHHDRSCAAHRVVNRLQHFHHAVRGAGSEQWLTGHQQTRIADVEAIDVFFCSDRFDDFVRIDMCRQRQLHQNAVDFRIVVQRFHPGQQFGLGHAGVVFFKHRMNAVFLASLDLVAHIDLGCLAIADQDHRQSGRTASGSEGGGAFGDVGPDFTGELIAIDDFCGHGVFSGGKEENGIIRRPRFDAGQRLCVPFAAGGRQALQCAPYGFSCKNLPHYEIKYRILKIREVLINFLFD